MTNDPETQSQLIWKTEDLPIRTCPYEMVKQKSHFIKKSESILSSTANVRIKDH